ncbi:hypothetical protein [Desulfolucanica intricata]|uniref:hypothetical protein n=1 Tax=Desulfolucanica intricata TaxID=1285191 RepID=UPI000832C081|nr:hypothetical protein [Desulfolucanica intricata]
MSRPTRPGVIPAGAVTKGTVAVHSSQHGTPARQRPVSHTGAGLIGPHCLPFVIGADSLCSISFRSLAEGRAR